MMSLHIGQPTVNSTDHIAGNGFQLPTKYENWKKGEEKFNKRFEPLKNCD